MADRDRFGGSERDYGPRGGPRYWQEPGVGRLPSGRDFFNRFRNPDTTTAPEGFNDPDRFGRMRPTQANNPYAGRINNNPMGGANIGGGWNLYEGGPDRRDYYGPVPMPMSSGWNREDAAVDPSDWRVIQQILNAGGNPDDYIQTAEMGGYGYNPAPKSYDDIYKGTDIIDMEVLPGVGYGPEDEYEFDKKRGYENRIWGKDPRYVARGGIMSLRR